MIYLMPRKKEQKSQESEFAYWGLYTLKTVYSETTSVEQTFKKSISEVQPKSLFERIDMEEPLLTLVCEILFQLERFKLCIIVIYNAE